MGKKDSRPIFTTQDFAFWKSAARVRRIAGTKRVRRSQTPENSESFLTKLGKMLVPRIR